MSNWKKLRRSVYETGQTILMFMFENKNFKWKTECILNRTNNFNAWIERTAYERGHSRSMLKKEKEKKMPTYVTEKTMLAEQPSPVRFWRWNNWFPLILGKHSRKLMRFPDIWFYKNTMFYRNVCCFRF